MILLYKFNFICLFTTYSIISVESVHNSKTIFNDNIYILANRTIIEGYYIFPIGYWRTFLISLVVIFQHNLFLSKLDLHL